MLMPGQLFEDMGSGENQAWAIGDTTDQRRRYGPKLAPEATLSHRTIIHAAFEKR